MRMINVVRAVFAGAVAAAGPAACSHRDDAGLEPVFDAHTFYQSLTVTERALNLATDAPYNTMQLHATARTRDGSPVTGTIIYTASDSTVTIDSTGLVTAHFSTASPAYIHASLTLNGLTRTDSIPVAVIEGTPPALLDHVSIEPAEGNSTTLIPDASNFDTPSLEYTVTGSDANNQPIDGLLIATSSSDTLLVRPTPGSNVVYGFDPGQVVLRVSTSAYGVTRTDSLVVTISMPRYGFVAITKHTPTGSTVGTLEFGPGSYTLAVGADVTWSNTTDLATDVVFDDPSAVEPASSKVNPYFNGYPGAGNIPAFHGVVDTTGTVIVSPNASRSFPRAGRYPYHSTRYSAQGVIVICDDVTILCTE